MSPQIETILQPCGVKFGLTLKIKLQKLTGVNTDVQTIPISSQMTPILNQGEIEPAIGDAMGRIEEILERFTNEGSGWQFVRIEKLLLHTATYQPFTGNSYIPLPANFPPRCVINVQNEDNKCFMWSILSAIHPVTHGGHPDRVAKYRPFENELCFDDIEFPVKVTDVPKFERLNPTLSVNVFGWNNGPYPLYISKQPNATPIDLLLITQDEVVANGVVTQPETNHYVWIKDLGNYVE